MHRSRIAALVVTMATLQPLHPLAANQAGEAFRVSKSQLADVAQETLQDITRGSAQPTEVFPGTYVSPYGALMMKRIEDLFARVGEADRATLLKENVGAGFDRSITSWRAHPNQRTVALAVQYHRPRLSQLEMELSDDYGRPEPLDPAEYEFFAVALCSRSGPETWTCQEEDLAAVARRHNLTVPKDRATGTAIVEKILESALANQ